MKNMRLKKLADWTNYDAGDNKIVQLLNDAIQYQTKIKIEYSGNWRIISPFAWGTSKEGDTVVKCYSVPGEGKSMDSGENGLDVKSFRIDKITNASPMPNETTDKGKYNNELDVANEYDDLQDKHDKNFGNDKYVANVDSEITKISYRQEIEPLFTEEETDGQAQDKLKELIKDILWKKDRGIANESDESRLQSLYELLDPNEIISSKLTKSAAYSDTEKENIGTSIEHTFGNATPDKLIRFERLLNKYLGESENHETITQEVVAMSDDEINRLMEEIDTLMGYNTNIQTPQPNENLEVESSEIKIAEVAEVVYSAEEKEKMANEVEKMYENVNGEKYDKFESVLNEYLGKDTSYLGSISEEIIEKLKSEDVAKLLYDIKMLVDGNAFTLSTDDELTKRSTLHQADEFHLAEDEVRENLSQYCISELEQEAERFGIKNFGEMTIKELIEELVDVYYLTDLSGTKTSSLNKSASDDEDFGPDDVKLTKEVDGYPIGTVCTIMDSEGSKYVLQINEDGHEIKTTKGNFKRLDGQKFEAWGSVNSKLKKEADTKEHAYFKEMAEKIESMESTAKDNAKFQEILCDYLDEVDPSNNMNIPEACMMLNTYKLKQLYEELCSLDYNDKIEKQAFNKLSESEDDDMSFDEVMAETVDCIMEMKRRVNEWSVRDTLKMFTSFSFYKDGFKDSIDESTATEIINKLLDYVDNLHESDIESLYEVHDIVSHFYKY